LGKPWPHSFSITQLPNYSITKSGSELPATGAEKIAAGRKLLPVFE